VTTAPSPTTTPVQPGTQRRLYDIVLALFCSLLLVSNIGATKLIAFGPSLTVGGFPVLPIITDGGAFLFPLTYILGDLLAEVYGMRLARRAILLGFGIALLASVTFLAVDSAPAAPGWDLGDAWHAVLGFVPRIVAASLAGFLAGQFLNAYVVVRLKTRARPGSLWWRLVSSTLVGELAERFGPLQTVVRRGLAPQLPPRRGLALSKPWFGGAWLRNSRPGEVGPLQTVVRRGLAPPILSY